MYKKLIFNFLFSFLGLVSFAQNTFQCTILDSVEKKPLQGATIQMEKSELGAFSDEKGNASISNVPNGTNVFVISYLGYLEQRITRTYPSVEGEKLLVIYLKPENVNEDEVIISSTRTNSRLEDQVQLVEVLGQEDMDEEAAIVPANVTSILGDLAIITIQRTNPVSGNDAVRMQGLNPQYTQIMRDGIPLYGGFSGSLGVLSIPPLDLKQVEIVKGSASTLYGGGAIAGLINLISKTPTDSPQVSILLNASTLKETNANVFLSGKKGKFGATLFGGVNWKQAVDVNKDGFSEIPEDHNLSIHPRLFYYISKKTELNVGLTTTYDARRSGDMNVLKGNADSTHVFMQREKTLRNVVDMQFHHDFSTKNSLQVKYALNLFSRETVNPTFPFSAKTNASYTEITDRTTTKRHIFIVGMNFIRDSFTVVKADSSSLINSYKMYNRGIFIQDDWKLHDKLLIQWGLRYDWYTYNSKGAWWDKSFLPRVAIFYKPNKKLSIRLASGTGYKMPNLLNYTDPVPNTTNKTGGVQVEKSISWNADINYKTLIGDNIVLTINQAFYYTRIKNSLQIEQISQNGMQGLRNVFPVISYGTDTYVNLQIDEIGIYLGYNHTEALIKKYTVDVPVPFNPKDKVSGTFSYEIEGKWRMGLEYSYVANQYVANGRKVPSYGFVAGMIERKFKYGSLVLNGENLLDARQSKVEPLVTGSTQSPVFTPIWGYVEGRVINLSLKLLIK